MNLDHFQHITCSQCVNYLAYIFDASDQHILIGGLVTTPAKFLTSLPSISTLPAAGVGPIQFTGGPPTNLGMYKGSFLTLLMDLLFQASATSDKKILRRIRNTTLCNAK